MWGPRKNISRLEKRTVVVWLQNIVLLTIIFCLAFSQLNTCLYSVGFHFPPMIFKCHGNTDLTCLPKYFSSRISSSQNGHPFKGRPCQPMLNLMNDHPVRLLLSKRYLFYLVILKLGKSVKSQTDRSVVLVSPHEAIIINCRHLAQNLFRT